MSQRIGGVILDVDGTLLNSNDAHAQAWAETLASFDIRATFEQIRPLIGMGGDKLLPEVAGLDADSERGRAISERRREIFKTRYLPGLKPFPKVRELLLRMKDAGLQLAVASSAKKDELHELLALAHADDILESVTSSDDAESSKPDPDIVHAALGKLGLAASHTLMLGDTPYDIQAAGKLGVGTIAFRCGGWSDADLKDAVRIYDGPADLLAGFDQSPLVSR
jgi:HAD superfamily hydrolase (TIGR01509 family)